MLFQVRFYSQIIFCVDCLSYSSPVSAVLDACCMWIRYVYWGFICNYKNDFAKYGKFNESVV